MKLDLREMVTAVQLEGLMTGEVDLGMARPPVRRPGLVSRPLLHEQLIAALPEAHPLVGLGRQLTLNDLDGQDVIMYSPVQARYFNELLISTFTIAGATPRYVQTVTQVHTMLVLVRSGIGIALVPASAATLHPEGVVFRSIGAFRERPVELDAVWRGDSTNPALLRLLRDVLPQREWTTDDLVEDVVGERRAGRYVQDAARSAGLFGRVAPGRPAGALLVDCGGGAVPDLPDKEGRRDLTDPKQQRPGRDPRHQQYDRHFPRARRPESDRELGQTNEQKYPPARQPAAGKGHRDVERSRGR